jgi:hypothetical protein
MLVAKAPRLGAINPRKINANAGYRTGAQQKGNLPARRTAFVTEFFYFCCTLVGKEEDFVYINT